LSPIGDNFNSLVKIQPVSEFQVRPLTVLKPAQQCEVWEAAVRNADGKVVTYKQVKALVAELLGPAPEPNLTRDSPIPGPRGEHLLPACPFPLGTPFAGRCGAVVALSAVDLSSRGRGLGADFMVLVLPGGKVRQEQGGRHPGPISTRLLLLASALFARVLLYER